MGLVLAYSLSGHDKGTLYVVVGRKEGRYLLADGKGKTVSSPKEKNSRHVQLVKKVPPSLEILWGQVPVSDETVKRALKLYQKEAGSNKADSNNSQNMISD